MEKMEFSMQLRLKAALAVAVLVGGLFVPNGKAQRGAEVAKNLRCTFQLNATGTWKRDGSPEAAVSPATLVLLFDSINVDEGTARIRNGTVETDLIVRAAAGYLNLIQPLRTGPLYTTTIFDKETNGGKLKAVHSRHEYFTTPLAGATSSPEQYYGECEITGR
jgi:hypothetical protein